MWYRRTEPSGVFTSVALAKANMNEREVRIVRGKIKLNLYAGICQGLALASIFVFLGLNFYINPMLDDAISSTVNQPSELGSPLFDLYARLLVIQDGLLFAAGFLFLTSLYIANRADNYS